MNRAIPLALLLMAFSPTPEQVAACAPDYFRLCAHVPLSDRAGIKKCMHAHRGELSEACRKAIERHG